MGWEVIQIGGIGVVPFDLPVPSKELGCLPRLKKLTLSRMDSFDSVVVGPQFLHLKNLSTLHLCCCPLREIQLDGLELLGDLVVKYCEFLEGLSVISSSLRKLSRMGVKNCPKLLQIRFLSTMESLERLRVRDCEYLGGLYGLSNSKKLKTLMFSMCPMLRVIEGLEELELLRWLYFFTCPSLKVLTNLSNSKIPNECKIDVKNCEKLPASGFCHYGDYRGKILDWTRRGLSQEGAARFFERGQPLIVQMLKKLEVPYDTLPEYRDGFVTLKWTGYPSLETLHFHYCLNLQKFDSSRWEDESSYSLGHYSMYEYLYFARRDWRIGEFDALLYQKVLSNGETSIPYREIRIIV
ncbi:uncharacterized protein LOC120291460 isoform X1 [Eucalyptus grandis]|uniref:uncharacterized protein LOC120291460 isoform X1 n=1 Tax=Eucalyptus grandis TaxID=71139 RepID=UPI00192EC076|nr:uncharacterized protein LOC120291460 isoform X1 [Eucalyptus grandis]